MKKEKPILYMIAGANGSGKSTYVKNLLQTPGYQKLPYVCPDTEVELICEEKNLHRYDMTDEQLRKIYLQAMELCQQKRFFCIQHKQSFIFETVLSTDTCMWMLIKSIISTDKCISMLTKMKLTGMAIIKYMGNNHRV